MNVVLWSLPIVAVMATTLAGRLGSIGAASLGVVLALAVALVGAPRPFGALPALDAAATGLWLGALVGAVIIGGLFFRDAAAARDDAAAPPRDARAAAFHACFLLGPFTETATGVGVGQVATVAALQPLGLAPLHVATLALFSQMLVPWGAMANGTIVGAALSGVPPIVLGHHSAVLSVPLLLVWLPMFWLFARRAGLATGPAGHLREVAWMVVLAGLLILANTVLDPEVAGLAALGPLLAASFARAAHGRPAVWRAGVRRAVPYGALIAGLIVSRHLAAIAPAVSAGLTLRPFGDAPGWNLLTHPSSWLVAVGLLAALLSGRVVVLPTVARRAWAQGRKSVLAVCLFLVMAQLMAKAGITDALAAAVHDALGTATVLAVPVLAGVFGFVMGSSNAANGLLMTAQVAVATEAGLAVAWIAAVQNTASAALTMLSPVRLAMACALAGRPDLERAVYARAWPLGALAVGALLAACALLVAVGGP